MMKIFIIIICVFFSGYLLEKIINKLLGVKKQRLSETAGKKADERGRGIILVVSICALPFFITQEIHVMKWYWIAFFMMVFGLQIFLEWKYIEDSKQYITSLIFLMIALLFWFNIEYVFNLFHLD